MRPPLSFSPSMRKAVPATMAAYVTVAADSGGIQLEALSGKLLASKTKRARALLNFAGFKFLYTIHFSMQGHERRDKDS